MVGRYEFIGYRCDCDVQEWAGRWYCKNRRIFQINAVSESREISYNHPGLDETAETKVLLDYNIWN